MKNKSLKINLPLVNCHCHAAMVAFSGLAEDKPLEEWLREYIWPAEKRMVNPKMVREETRKAIKEMKKNKIAAFCDMYFFEEEVAKVAEEERMPVVIGEGLLDFPTPSYKSFSQGLEITKNLLEKYKNHPLVKVSVAPHSIYTLSKEHLIEAKKLAEKYKALYQIHCAETKKEFEECQKEYKKTPVEFLDSLGVLNKRTLLVHCVWLTEKDIKIIAKRKAKVVYCPLSNAKLGSGIAPIAKMLKNKVLVCLGTDGAASSNRLDIWEAAKFGALLQKAANLDARVLSLKEIIKIATVNGMNALGFEKLAGKDVKEWRKVIQKNDFSCLYSFNFC